LPLHPEPGARGDSGCGLRRRDLLRSALALPGAWLATRLPGQTPPAPTPPETFSFPKGFLWGASTSAYQIEGAVHEDGRGESIWDRFSHTPGVTKNGATGDIACDSYHRYREDVALMRALNLSAYRFSIAWPRIQPSGQGAPNRKGLDYYRRLVDALLAAGIQPLPTLYHWDIPLALIDSGGWPNRDTAGRFTDYAAIMGRALGDRVKQWALFNEPKAATHYGYLPQNTEPCGNDALKHLRASHTINLAQGQAFAALKSIARGIKASSVFDLSPMYPATDSEADRAAAHRFHLFQNLWYIKPALEGRYPEGVVPAERLYDLLGFRDGDERLMRAELDYIGINYYSRFFVRHAPLPNGVPGLDVRPAWGAAAAKERTDFGWEVYPQGLYEIIATIHRETGGKRILHVTENGAAYNTAPGADGRIPDSKRTDFLRAHIGMVARAIADGYPVSSYYCWSLLDNFEWLQGYTQRFGLVYVDFEHGQSRTIKESGRWYARVAGTNQLA
jgi:beta-glucosidase